jgi:hypothetical protein
MFDPLFLFPPLAAAYFQAPLSEVGQQPVHLFAPERLRYVKPGYEPFLSTILQFKPPPSNSVQTVQ